MSRALVVVGTSGRIKRVELQGGRILDGQKSDAVRLTPCIQGVTLLPMKSHSDGRGELGILESGTDLGFDIKRVFYVKVDHAGVIRAEHANSASEVIVVLAGAVTIDLDNGRERQTLTLIDATKAVRIQAGVWLRLRDFSPCTLLLVVCSHAYADTITYGTPQPALLFR
ncbi:MAG: FdtA/QdtA family cupin domain-containing protein [Capsulimonadaceae bacterium]|nr:FdtA/QdtA family cupin domain-containing protein [Capsulimonadaceae bacterium]